jgi:hypothetical protein
MLGNIKTSFDDALKLQMPQVTPSVILAILEAVPGMSQTEKLRAYGKLILSERLFYAFLELPMEVRKKWLLMLA